MPAEGDIALARLAVQLGFCAAPQVEAALRIQAKTADGRSLGHHLVSEGFISQDQHSELLRRQREILAARPKVGSDDRLFGRLAVREGLATQAQIDDALRSGGGRGLGDVLRERGVLSTAEVEWLLGMQSKWIMRCPRCQGTFTVHSSSKNPRKANCPRCRVPLEPKGTHTTVASEGEVETSVNHKALRPSAGGGPTCKICGLARLSEPDPEGRVECFACRVRFKP